MKLRLLTIAIALALPACETMTPIKVVSTETGYASWYSRATNTPKYTGITASGITMYDHGATAAHKTLPFGTKVKFTNLETGQSEILTITDRGPYKRGRIIDVTIGAAKRTGFYHRGVVKCKVEVLR